MELYAVCVNNNSELKGRFGPTLLEIALRVPRTHIARLNWFALITLVSPHLGQQFHALIHKFK
jgi:hypothetical protein